MIFIYYYKYVWSFREMFKQKQDLRVEEETDEDFMTRITQPRIWTVFKLDFICQVLPDDRIDEVLEMFKVII